MKHLNDAPQRFPVLRRACLPWFIALLVLTSAHPATAADYATAEKFRRLMVSYSDWAAAQDPSFASAMGDRRWNKRWPDTSAASQAQRLKQLKGFQKTLRGFDVQRLSPENQLQHQLLQHAVTTALTGFVVGPFHKAVTPQQGPQLDFSLADLLTFQSERDFEDWLGRLSNFPLRVSQSIEGMEHARRKNFLLDRHAATRIAAQIQSHIGKATTDSPFYAPFHRFPTDFSSQKRNHLQQTAKHTLEKQVFPALRRFQDYWTRVYLPATPQRDGLSSHPAGPALYDYLLRVHCSIPVSAPLLHARARNEVDELLLQLDSLRAEVGFAGDVQNFIATTQADIRFRHPSKLAALAEYELLVRRLKTILPGLFRHTELPPCSVVAVPEKQTAGAPPGYYLPANTDGTRGGIFFVNLGDLSRRPAYEAAPLVLHEAIPGHHLQFSRQLQHPEWPAFRRLQRYSAYIEGWGLYAESLGEPLGLYRDPYARFGYLNLKLRRAIRAVIDTGLHAGYWSRRDAKSYYLTHCPRQEHDIEADLDQIIFEPGEAAASKVGEWKILDLQARAREALGTRYDVREFHEAILKDGVIPLDMLETRFDAWLEASGGTLPHPTPF